MKINFGAKILGIDGKTIPDGERNLTLGAVCCTALLASYPDETNLEAALKVKRFRLAEIAVKNKEQELPVDDIAELKRLIAKAFGPLIVGRAFDLIEPVVGSSEKKKSEVES